MDVYDLLIEAEKKYGEKAAIINNEDTIDFAALKRNTFILANRFSDLGLKKGDKVAVYLPNSPEYFYIYLACYLTGVIIVPIDFYLNENEVTDIIDHCGIKVLFSMVNPRTNLSMLANKTISLKAIVSIDDNPQFISFAQLIAAPKNHFKKVDIDEDSYSSIFYTSGSTGQPKGVIWNYKHIHIGAENTDYFLEIDLHKDRVITAIPMSHSGGVLLPMMAIKYGVSTVIMERFHPLEYVKLVEKWKVSFSYMVPPMFLAILALKDAEHYDLSSMRVVAVFGAPSDPEVIKQTKRIFINANIVGGWGMTEVIPPTSVGSPGDLASVGKPNPKVVELKIVDENGTSKESGEIGELLAKGESIFLGYYNAQEYTSEVFENGWFKTGDLAKYDNNGNLYIVGRSKDMIKVGGAIVWSAEVEGIILRHPCVLEAAVIGVPDKIRGEVVKAFIVLKDEIVLPKRYIIEYCKQYLAKYKAPKDVEYVLALPKTGSGKIDKAKLKVMNG